jgi:hypothetical protein
MPSCSNSSNIISSINALNVSLGGSRLSTTIDYVSGLTVGNVIRYNVASTGYTASKADTAVNAEVFGVIESYDSSINKFNVVIYGSVSLTGGSLVDMGSGGGGGGNDIYFLSGLTAGKLQNLAPTNLDHIVKPVYQACPHGSFTGVIVNYLGYKVGGDISGISESDVPSGDLRMLIGTSSFEEGYVDASISHDLPIADYPDFYEKFSTQYGYVERLTVNSTSGLTIDKVVTQTNSSYSGRIKSIDSINNYVYIVKSPGTSLASTNKYAVINGINKTVTASEVYSVYTPIISLPQQLVVNANDGSLLQSSQTVKIGLRVKDTGLRVSIPTTINTTSSITANELFVGSTPINVKTYITDLNTRLELIEERLRM